MRHFLILVMVAGCGGGSTPNNNTPTCGNGMIDADELCDTAITSGEGACPVTCDDADGCTADELTGEACMAACTHTVTTTLPIDGDACCPPTANANIDTDCAAVCGNGIVEIGELCDVAIDVGEGKCVTDCSDGVACTTDTLIGVGTCQAACEFPAITTAVDGDACCPAGANANTDDDCQPDCGNSVVESGEQCDDGNETSGDGCTATCQDAPPRLDVTVDTAQIDTDLGTTHVVAVTLTASDNFAGLVTLTPTLDDGNGGTLAGWSVLLDQTVFDLTANGTATAMATITIPTRNNGLSGVAKFTATSAAVAGDPDATTTITARNQVTMGMTLDGNGFCEYPADGNTEITVGSKIRWLNNSLSMIVMHIDSNISGCPHESSPGTAPGGAYECLITAAGTPFKWYCHAPGLDVGTRTIQGVSP